MGCKGTKDQIEPISRVKKIQHTHSNVSIAIENTQISLNTGIDSLNLTYPDCFDPFKEKGKSLGTLLKGISEDDYYNIDIIQTNFTYMNSSEFDQLFSFAQKKLEKAESIRKRLVDDRDKLISITHSDQLFNRKKRIQAAIQVLFWSLSAENEGRIQKFLAQLQKTAPYFRFPEQSPIANNSEASKAVNRYLVACMISEEEIITIIDKLWVKLEELKLLKHSIPGEGSQFLKNYQIFKDNVDILRAGYKQCRLLKELMVNTAYENQQIIDGVQMMYNVADNEGSRFYSKGIKDCAKIFEIRYSEGFFKENS